MRNLPPINVEFDLSSRNQRYLAALEATILDHRAWYLVTDNIYMYI